MTDRERDKAKTQGPGQREPAARQFPVRPAFGTPVGDPSSPVPGPAPAYPPPSPYASPPLTAPAPGLPPPPPAACPPPVYPSAYGVPPPGVTAPVVPASPAGAWVYPPGTWTPRADVYQENGDYVIITDIPGIDLDTLDLTWDDGELILEATIRSPEKADRKPVVRERPSGTYYRRIPLGPDLDPAGAVASYCDGTLEVRVPRKRRRPRRTRTVRVKRADQG